MPLQIGINVLEVDGPATPALQAAPRASVAAFVGRARRGVPHQAVRVTDPSQFLTQQRRGPRTDAYTGLAVLGFFLNGGRETYIVRVVGVGSAAAVRPLMAGADLAADSLQLRADTGARRTRYVGQRPAGRRTRRPPGVDEGETSDVARDRHGRGPGLAFPDSRRVGPGAAGGGRYPLPDRHRDRCRRQPVTWDGGLGAAVAKGAVGDHGGVPPCDQAAGRGQRRLPLGRGVRRLSMQPGTPSYVIDELNHPAAGSRFVTVADLDHGVHAGRPPGPSPPASPGERLRKDPTVRRFPRLLPVTEPAARARHHAAATARGTRCAAARRRRGATVARAPSPLRGPE